MTIAVIVCDTPIAGYVDTFGDFGDQLKALLREGGCQQPLRRFDAVALELPPPCLALSGVIISGSRSDAWRDEAWVVKLVEWVAATVGRVPIVGVCFGHQILGRALGMAVGPTAAWETGVMSFPINPKARQALGGASEILIVESHLDQVTGPLPAGVEIIGSTEQCVVQGLYLESKRVLSFQGHPEFLPAASLWLIKAQESRGAIPAEQAAEALRQNETVAPTLLAGCIAGFLL